MCAVCIGFFSNINIECSKVSKSNGDGWDIYNALHYTLLWSWMAPHRGATVHLWPFFFYLTVPTSGIGRLRVTHNAEICIFWLNHQFPRSTLQTHWISPRSHEIIPTTPKFLIVTPEIKYKLPVVSSNCAFKDIRTSDNIAIDSQ